LRRNPKLHLHSLLHCLRLMKRNPTTTLVIPMRIGTIPSDPGCRTHAGRGHFAHTSDECVGDPGDQIGMPKCHPAKVQAECGVVTMLGRKSTLTARRKPPFGPTTCRDPSKHLVAASGSAPHARLLVPPSGAPQAKLWLWRCHRQTGGRRLLPFPLSQCQCRASCVRGLCQ
jgi:hypothetical protein